MDLVTPAMLNRLADLRAACPRQEICFLLGTNYVENIDLALIRKGRIDAAIAIVYPDFESRVAIVSKYARKVSNQTFPTSEQEFAKIATKTTGWPYLDILSCCERIGRTYNVAAHEDFEEILNAAVLERESTSTNATYDNRRRITGELFDEYVHHLISCSENRQQCIEELEKNEKMKKSFPNHRLILESTLNKEERWLSEAP
jgi:SpoVK/Ycf46/Vps4 family AAA+-type ATPase